MPVWLRTAQRLHLARLLRRIRYDTRLLPAAERATDDDGLRMLALAVHAKRYSFELEWGSATTTDDAEGEIIAVGRRELGGAGCHAPVDFRIGQTAASVINSRRGDVGGTADKMRPVAGLRRHFKFRAAEFLHL